MTGTDFTGATSVTIGGNECTDLVVVNATTITCTTPAGTLGAKNVVVTTPGGTDTLTDGYTYVPAPGLTSLTPNEGPAAGGQSVTLTGTDFTGATSVTIGGNECTDLVVVNATTITCTTPAGTPGPRNVVVTTPGGTDTLTDAYTYIPAPDLSSLTPDEGPTTGGGTITLTGTDFTGATSVTIGGNECTSLVVVNATTITCTVPAGTVGAKDVVVTTPGGTDTLTDAYTYVPVPGLTSLTPEVGPTAGGQTVTITGTDLTGTTSVTIGGNECSNVVVVNATTVTCTTPEGAVGTEDVVVTTPGGSDTITDGYTYVLPPTIADSILPSAAVLVGDAVTITTDTSWPAGYSIARQWQVSEDDGTTWQDVPGATSQDYIPGSDQIGKKLRLKETGTKGGESVVLHSNTLGPVVGWVAPAVVTGDAQVGEELTAAPGQWGPGSSNPTITGQWQYFDGTTWVDIAGATGKKLTVPAAAANREVRYKETATLEGVRVPQPSNEVGPVVPAATPTVTRVTPTRGVAGTRMTITGTGFTPDSQVTVGGEKCLEVVVINSTTITCVLPKHSAGAVSVVVTTPNGSAEVEDAITYKAGPGPETSVEARDRDKPLRVGHKTTLIAGVDSDGRVTIKAQCRINGVNVKRACDITINKRSGKVAASATCNDHVRAWVRVVTRKGGETDVWARTWKVDRNPHVSCRVPANG